MLTLVRLVAAQTPWQGGSLSRHRALNWAHHGLISDYVRLAPAWGTTRRGEDQRMEKAVPIGGAWVTIQFQVRRCHSNVNWFDQCRRAGRWCGSRRAPPPSTRHVPGLFLPSLHGAPAGSVYRRPRTTQRITLSGVPQEAPPSTSPSDFTQRQAAWVNHRRYRMARFQELEGAP